MKPRHGRAPRAGYRRGRCVYNGVQRRGVWVSRRDNSRGHTNVHTQPFGTGFGFLSLAARRLRQEGRGAASRAAAAPAAPAVDTDADKVVNVYNWSDYIDPTVLEDFEKETGVKVNYEVMDSNELLETKLVAGRTGYDVVVPSASFLARQIKAGIYQKLDKSKLPNLKNLDPDITERLAAFDPGNEYAVNYMWGTSGVAYNEEAIKAAMPDAPVDSFSDVLGSESGLEVREVRRLGARCALRSDRHRADLPRQGCELRRSRRTSRPRRRC